MSAAVDIGIMQSMMTFGFNYIIATSVGFFFGLIVNYLFHAIITFQSISGYSVILRFILVVGINYIITVAFVTLSLYTLDSALIGKISSLPFVAVNGFMLSKYWVFKSY